MGKREEEKEAEEEEEEGEGEGRRRENADWREVSTQHAKWLPWVPWVPLGEEDHVHGAPWRLPEAQSARTLQV